MKKRFPTLNRIPWLCSANDIDWETRFINNRNLDYIAFRHGFWFEHHRAEIDARAVIHLLTMQFDEDETNFQRLLSRTFSSESFNLICVKSPFEVKDQLKSLGLRWNADRKVWFKPNINSAEISLLKSKLNDISAEITTEIEGIDLIRRYD